MTRPTTSDHHDNEWVRSKLSETLRADAAEQHIPDDVRARIEQALVTEQQLRLERVDPTAEDPYAEVDVHWGSYGTNLPDHYTKRGLGMRPAQDVRAEH